MSDYFKTWTTSSAIDIQARCEDTQVVIGKLILASVSPLSEAQTSGSARNSLFHIASDLRCHVCFDQRYIVCGLAMATAKYH